MNIKNIAKYVLGEAAKSNSEKRKVGCIIVNKFGQIVAQGHNVISTSGLAHHAEARCVETFIRDSGKAPYTAYVSHPPCPVCAALMMDAGVDKVEVLEAFVKFDGDKLRLDLVPPSTVRGIGEVLTFGARKYKPNNWRECTDLTRYEAAMLRHIQLYREGEAHDVESGMPHLWHAMTNLAFLIELDGKSHEKRDILGPDSAQMELDL